MGGVDLDLVGVARAHRLDSLLGLLEQLGRVNESEADVDSGCVIDRVGAGLDDGGGESTGGGLEDEVEGVVGVELETGELGRCVAERVRDGGETLSVAVHRERDEGGRRELELVPFEGDLQRETGEKGRREEEQEEEPLTLV